MPTAREFARKRPDRTALPRHFPPFTDAPPPLAEWLRARGTWVP